MNYDKRKIHFFNTKMLLQRRTKSTSKSTSPYLFRALKMLLKDVKDEECANFKSSDLHDNNAEILHHHETIVTTYVQNFTIELSHGRTQ